MKDLVVKSVDLFGDSVMAAQDREGNIWAGVTYFCKALGMSKNQRDAQVDKVQLDKTLSKGCGKFPLVYLIPQMRHMPCGWTLFRFGLQR